MKQERPGAAKPRDGADKPRASRMHMSQSKGLLRPCMNLRGQKLNGQLHSARSLSAEWLVQLKEQQPGSLLPDTCLQNITPNIYSNMTHDGFHLLFHYPNISLYILDEILDAQAISDPVFQLEVSRQIPFNQGTGICLQLHPPSTPCLGLGGLGFRV